MLNSSERKIATPSVPPSWRKKVAELVATPISRGGTAFWTMIVSGCMHWPRPRPRNTIPPITHSRLVSAPTNDSATIDSPAMPEPMIGKIRMLPVREVICPVTMPALIMPSTIGSIIRPALVGEAPWTICMYCGSTVIAPNIAAPTMTLAPITTAAARSLKIRSGIRASSPIRRSASTKAATPAAPMTYAASERPEPQPHSRPCSATVSSGTSATTSEVAPIQSMRASRRTWCRCRLRVTTNSAAMPIGTLIRNTQRQPVTPRIES